MEVISSLSYTGGVSQGCTLGSPSFIIVINDLCAKINNSNFILFSDHLKMYHEIFC
jgi:hypothetical protein